MKTAREQTAAILARLSAEESYINGQQQALKVAVANDAALKEQIAGPRAQALAAAVHASHAADAAFLAWRARG